MNLPQKLPKNIQSWEPLAKDNRRVIYKIDDCLYIEAPEGSVLADHKHHETETLWIIEGSGILQIDKEDFQIEAHTKIVIPSDVYHKLTVTSDMKFVELKI